MTQPHSRPGSEAVITACVVTYNRLDHITHGLDRLVSEPVDHIVIVDNGSSDGTREMLAAAESSNPRVHVVLAPTNGGGAGGFEIAVRYAIDHFDQDWLLLLDDDAAPEPGSIDRFRSMRLTDDVGSVAAAVYTPAGEICEMNRPGLVPFGSVSSVVKAVVGGRMALHVGDEAYQQPRTDIDCASFVGWFLRADLVRNGLGFPRGEFFIYADDQSYSYGVRRLGFRNVFNPSIRFEHDTDSRSNAGVITPYWKIYFLYRNTIEFYREASGWWFPLVMAFKIPVWALRGRRYDHRVAYLRLLWLGMVDGFRRRFTRSRADIAAVVDRMIPG